MLYLLIDELRHCQLLALHYHSRMKK